MPLKVYLPAPMHRAFRSMRSLLCILILSGLVLQIFCKAFVVAGFELNRETIAKTLCVKKDIPNNGCQGKCHLMKQLEQVEEREGQQTPHDPKRIPESPFFLNNTSFSGIKHVVAGLDKSFPALAVARTSSPFLGDVFQPPELG